MIQRYDHILDYSIPLCYHEVASTSREKLVIGIIYSFSIEAHSRIANTPREEIGIMESSNYETLIYGVEDDGFLDGS